MNFFFQLSNVIFPEVQFSDDFEQANIFIQTAAPCLANLLKIVDLFISESKHNCVDSLCKEVLKESEIPQTDQR